MAQKRRHDGSPVVSKRPPPKITNGRNVGSSQVKSQFEEEVLEKLTQDIHGLKHKNSEKDQQWARPSLDDFNEKTDNICFQQIDAEEGTLHGGRTTIKLFGATEVSLPSSGLNDVLLIRAKDWTLCPASCHGLLTLSIRRRPSLLCEKRL